MDKIRKLTIDDVLDDGGQVDIHFFDCGDLQGAYNKLKPYRHLGKVERRLAPDGTVWLAIDTRYIDVTAFL